jgi:hypothetical protein
MNSSTKLLLHHEIMLLALCDEKGTFQSCCYVHAVAGAMLTELVLMKRISIGSDKLHMVSLLSDKPVGDELLDELLDKIASSKKPRGLSEWIGQAVAIKNLAHRVAKQLCDKRILRNHEQKTLWIFTHQIYPEIKPKYEREIKNRMSKLMFGQTTQHDERTTALVSLAKHTGLLCSNFDKQRLKDHKQRIDKVASGDLFAARANTNAVEAMEAALMVATIMPMVIAN